MYACIQVRQEVMLVTVPHDVADGCIGVWGRYPHTCVLAQFEAASRCEPISVALAVGILVIQQKVGLSEVFRLIKYHCGARLVGWQYYDAPVSIQCLDDVLFRPRD
ncbi:unnamed protein product [Dibothriocephalus latus]|uniref:Uncharacterized protein n=1 Tax=Dibothriocephalus latus TaxID=60516 RepID=A0A3P7L8Q7_DIBLA|nr:unnamed protein product [Dibothriocephalus latus]